MNRWAWLAAGTGVFALGVAAGRSARFGLPSVFGEDTDVARLLTVTESINGIVVPAPPTFDTAPSIPLVLPGLVTGTVAILFYHVTFNGSGTYHARVQSATPISMFPTEHAFSGSDNIGFSWQEIIPASLLTPDNNNELILAVSADDTRTTSVTFSNVAILYQSNQLTVPRPPVFAP